MREADRARREARLADAHRDLIEAVALSRRAADRRELVHALKGLGQIERDMGRNLEALACYAEAVALCRQLADPLLLAHTVRHLGDVHRHAASLDLAESCYDEALALYRSRADADRLDLANAIRPLAILKEATGDLAEARRLWTAARDLYASVDVRAGVEEGSARIARLTEPH